MVPRLVPEISSLDAFCDGAAAAGAAAGVGFSFQHGAADVGLSRWAECTFANRGDPNSPKI